MHLFRVAAMDCNGLQWIAMDSTGPFSRRRQVKKQTLGLCTNTSQSLQTGDTGTYGYARTASCLSVFQSFLVHACYVMPIASQPAILFDRSSLISCATIDSL